jgi:hypothetical protein
MLASIWAFLQDGSNQATLGWIGGGVVVVVGGLWAVFKFLASERKKDPPPPTLSVSATNGGVAAGRDIRDNKIDNRGGSKR